MRIRQEKSKSRFTLVFAAMMVDLRGGKEFVIGETAANEKILRQQNTSESVKPTKIQVAIWASLLLIAVFAYSLTYQGVDLVEYKDSSSYIVLAHSLLHYDRYGLINVPGEPGATTFPFGYPLLLALVIRLFPDYPDGMKLVSFFATITNMILLFWGWRRLSRSSHWWSLGVVGLYGFSLLATQLSAVVLSEPIFTTFCLAAILLAARAASGKQGPWSNSLLSIVLVFAIFTRTIGLALLPAIFTYLLFTRGRGVWKYLLLIVVQMTVLVALVVGFTAVEARDIVPSEYLRKQSDILQTKVDDGAAESKIMVLLLRRPVWFFGKNLGVNVREAVLPFGGGEYDQRLEEIIGIRSLLGLFVFGLVVLGYFRWVSREGLSIFSLFSMVYLGSLYFWTWNDSRLLYPILPQLQFGLLLGIEGCLFLITTPFKKTSPSGSLNHRILLGAAMILISVSGIRSFISIQGNRSQSVDFQAGARWLVNNSPASAIVMTEWPRHYYIYSGRKTAGYPDAIASPGELETRLDNDHIDYVLIAPEFKHRAYSDRTVHLLSLIEHLAMKNRVKLLHVTKSDSIADSIKVYKVEPPLYRGDRV